ncbi:uncharacterized protein LOC118191067 isoform X1 [Stegodyphus dumicola]|uniref:uncharacterized protein LOC118191067 isoform X1 n=1 Tax=Stegodyphus dumicola TaxID=202533 RepID=UPI0015B0B4E9|nr:uncharacterized protein LOC118191067 isoform X1 [Stegodyphus dumicola]
MSSSPTNSSPKSPSPRVPIRPRKKAAPKAPSSQSTKSMITRSLSCGGFQANVLARANTVHNNNKLYQHSVSHEDLLKANYNEIPFSDKIAKGSDETATVETNPPVSVNNRPKSRPKPPRHHRNGLPPVAERTHKVIERPSVPPPERPDSYAKSDSVSSEDVFIDNDKALDLDDISISLNSSGSETYNECQMSFMDESDNEERFSKSATKNERNSITNEDHRELNNNKSEVFESLNGHSKRTISSNNKNLTINGTSSSEFVNGISNSKKVPVSVVNNTDYEVNDSNVQVNEKNSNSFSVDSNVANGCHFTGGTPTWFEHYGDDKRQSTLWFSNQETDEMTYYNKAELEEIDRFEYNEDASQCENFRTIIEVGSTSEIFSSSKNALYQSTVSGTAIKLRVNSETQDTRL